MAKTYDRIRVLLEEVRSNQAGTRRDLGQFVGYLGRRRIKALLVDASKGRYLSEDALRRLVLLLASMKLLEITDSDIRLTATGRHALVGDNYNSMISTAALEYLTQFGIALDSIHQAIESVQLPDVPEAEKIFEVLVSPDKDRLGFDRFRMVLYLLHCTNRLTRHIKVLYGRRRPS